MTNHTAAQSPTDWQPHFAQIKQILKGQPFWKTALLSLMCLQRQWPVYERLSVGREWGNPKAIAKVLERFWKALPTGYAIGDSFWAILDENTVVVEEDWDTLASDFIVTLQSMFTIFEEKDKVGALAVTQRNTEFLDTFFDFENTSSTDICRLVAAEKAFQLDLATQLVSVQVKDKPSFIAACHSRQTDSILADLWFQNYPSYPPLKKRPTKSTGDGLRFRTPHQTKCVDSKNWNLVLHGTQQILLGLEDLKQANYQADALLSEPAFTRPDGTRCLNQTQVAISLFAQQKYLHFYSSLCFKYSNLAHHSYLSGDPAEEILRRLYQAAQCAKISIKLYSTLSDKERNHEALQKLNWGFGHSGLHWAMLTYDYEWANIIAQNDAPPQLLFLNHMLLGRYQEAEKLLPKCQEQPDPVYGKAVNVLLSALYGRDSQEIRKCLLQLLRAIRRMEDLYCEIFPVIPILVMRCANQLGLSFRKIEVSELWEPLTGVASPFDPDNSQPFGVEQIAHLL